MQDVNIHEAKTQLSKLVARVEAGAEVRICRSGKPVARLVPVSKRIKKRTAGRYKGKGRVAENFDAPLPDEVLRLFYE